MPLEHGITVLVSSHLLSEVEQMASRVGIIREGKMVLQDTIASLQSQTGSTIRLMVSEPEEAIKLAREQGQFGQQQGAVLTFPYMDNTAVALLIRRLIEQEHDVYRVEEQRQSLEDLFLRVIGEGASV
jgi:ABC-2 type transport system ATP-binding protein